MRYATVVIAALLSGSPAFASGGLWCNTDDGKALFSIESGITRGLGNPLFGFKGNLEIRDASVAADLRRSEFGNGHLTQHWVDAKELKMQLFRERGGDGPVGEVELLIETRMVDESVFEGDYVLTVSDMTGVDDGEARRVELKGKTSCGVE